MCCGVIGCQLGIYHCLQLQHLYTSHISGHIGGQCAQQSIHLSDCTSFQLCIRYIIESGNFPFAGCLSILSKQTKDALIDFAVNCNLIPAIVKGYGTKADPSPLIIQTVEPHCHGILRVIDMEEQILLRSEILVNMEASGIIARINRSDIHGINLTIRIIICCTDGSCELCIRSFDHSIHVRIAKHRITIHLSNASIQLGNCVGSYKDLLLAQSIVCLLSLVNGHVILEGYSICCGQCVDQCFNFCYRSIRLHAGDAIEVRNLPLAAVRIRRQLNAEVNAEFICQKLQIVCRAEVRQHDAGPGIGLEVYITSRIPILCRCDGTLYIRIRGIIDVEHNIVAELKVHVLLVCCQLEAICSCAVESVNRAEVRVILNDLAVGIGSAQTIVGFYVIYNFVAIQVVAVIGVHAKHAGNHPAFPCEGRIRIVCTHCIEVNGLSSGEVVIHQSGCATGMGISSVEQLHSGPLLRIQGLAVTMDPTFVTKLQTHSDCRIRGIVDVQSCRPAILICIRLCVRRNGKVCRICKGHDPAIGIDGCIVVNSCTFWYGQICTFNDHQLAGSFQLQILKSGFASFQLCGIDPALESFRKVVIQLTGCDDLCLVGKGNRLRQYIDCILYIRNQLVIVGLAVVASDLPLTGNRIGEGPLIAICCHVGNRDSDQGPGFCIQQHIGASISSCYILCRGIVDIELDAFILRSIGLLQCVCNLGGVIQLKGLKIAIFSICCAACVLINNTIACCQVNQGVQLHLQIGGEACLLRLAQSVVSCLSVHNLGVILRHYSIFGDVQHSIHNHMNICQLHIAHLAVDQHQSCVAFFQVQGIRSICGFNHVGFAVLGHRQGIISIKGQGDILFCFIVIVDHIECVLAVVVEATDHCTLGCIGSGQTGQTSVSCGADTDIADCLGTGHHKALMGCIHQHFVNSQNLLVDTLNVIIVIRGLAVCTDQTVTVVVVA